MITKPFSILLILRLIILTDVVAIERAVESEKGMGFAGVPILNYSSDYGFGFGGILALYDYGDGDIPYRSSYRLKFLITTKGKHKHYFHFDHPKFLDTKLRITSKILFKYVPYEYYFGRGNDSIYNSEFENNESSQYISNQYYRYNHLQPLVDLNFLHPIFKRFYFLVGYQFIYSEVELFKTSLLQIQEPLGIGDNKISSIKSGIILDTRDNEPSPRKGTFSEITAGYSFNQIGSDYDFLKLAITTKNYFNLLPHMVYAFRMHIKNDFGDLPFYEYAHLGGYTPIYGLGGEETLRGFQQNRFIDKLVFLINNEIRYDMITIILQNQRFDWSIIGFFDSGRVYDGLSGIKWGNYKFSGGFGISFAWNKYFVVRGDMGFSEEGIGAYVGFGHIF